MDISNWTLRQKIKVAIPVLAATVFALQNAACSVAHSYSVRNESPESLLYADSYGECNSSNLRAIDDDDWHLIDSGSTRSSFSSGSAVCLIVADLQRERFVRAEFRSDAEFVIRGQGDSLSIEVVGGDTPDDDLDFFGLSSLVIAIPFLIGMVVAGFITLQFFYRYYLRGDKSSRLGE